MNQPSSLILRTAQRVGVTSLLSFSCGPVSVFFVFIMSVGTEWTDWKWKVVPTFTLWFPVNLFRNLAWKCELQSTFQASLWHFLSSMGGWWSGHTDHNHTRWRAEGQSGDPGGLTILSPTWCSSSFHLQHCLLFWCCSSSSAPAPSSPPRTSSKGSI